MKLCVPVQNQDGLDSAVSLHFGSAPYFLFFELLGAPVELIGYVLMPILYLTGVLSIEFMAAFLVSSIVFGSLVSVAAVVVSAWSERIVSRKLSRSALFEYRSWTHLAVLMTYAVLENFGYRQLTLWWRTRGIWDYLHGKAGWEKFDRKGFQSATSPNST